MRSYLLVFLSCFILIQLSSAQSFQTLCPNTNTNGTVVDFEYYQDTLYATGFFNRICGERTKYIARWENDTWVPSKIELDAEGHILTTIKDTLFIGKYAANSDSNWVYFYDGHHLQKLGAGVYLTTASSFNLANIYDIVQYDNKIIACGDFDRVGNTAISGIMQWNGNNWEALGDGLSGNIPNNAPVIYPHKMIVHEGELYVIGNFRYAGNVEGNGIAKWNGATWEAMGAGFNGTVYGIHIFQDTIYAGGSFTKSGTTDLNRIAKWDGAAWVDTGFGFTPRTSNDFIFVHSFMSVDSTLFIAGGLKQVSYPNDTKEDCGGIVSYTNGLINTYNGGVTDRDIEAVIKDEAGNLLIGGGVFGRGYLGILSTTTSTMTIENPSSIAVYPNPFTERLSIKSNIPIQECYLIDIVGNRQSIALQELSNLQLNKLSKGIYFLEILTANGNITRKIVKQ